MELIRGFKAPTEAERAFAAAKYEILKRELAVALHTAEHQITALRWQPQLPIIDIEQFPPVAITSARPEQSYVPFRRPYRRHTPRLHNVKSQVDLLLDQQREQAERRRATYFQPGRN